MSKRMEKWDASFEERFWSRVDARGDCWLWTGWVNPEGYGSVTRGGIPRGVHRVAYELTVGPIADGLHLDHLCRVHACVNPDHLEPVTPRENVRRGYQSVAMKRATRCRRGHEYTELTLLIARNGARQCRVCRRLSQAASRRRLAA